MNIFVVLLSVILSHMIFNFSSDSNPKQWKVVDDVVMGGISSSRFSIDNNGHGNFSGHVSLENNGGFSSVRYQSNQMNISNCKQFEIRLKGDGKAYQFRVKSSMHDSHSYKFIFETNSNWQIIQIPFNLLSPSFRGRDLKIPNFSGNNVEEVGFLIANKKEEDFQLKIDYIKSI